MHYDPRKPRDHGLTYSPFKALVVPRPIGWISSLSPAGVVNLAPYSFFNAVSETPAMVMFSSAGVKHSQANIESTGEFVVNLAVWDLRQQVADTGANLAEGQSEADFANLEMVSSVDVKPPRVAKSPAALECKYVKTVDLHGADGTPSNCAMIIGEVIGVYIDDAIITEGRVDLSKAKPISRLGYKDYAVVENIFPLKIPKVE